MGPNFTDLLNWYSDRDTTFALDSSCIAAQSDIMEKGKEFGTINETPRTSISHGEDSSSVPCVPEKYRGTAADKHDMQVLGREQVLRRNFRSITIMGFASMV